MRILSEVVVSGWVLLLFTFLSEQRGELEVERGGRESCFSDQIFTLLTALQESVNIELDESENRILWGFSVFVVTHKSSESNEKLSLSRHEQPREMIIERQKISHHTYLRISLYLFTTVPDWVSYLIQISRAKRKFHFVLILFCCDFCQAISDFDGWEAIQ